MFLEGTCEGPQGTGTRVRSGSHRTVESGGPVKGYNKRREGEDINSLEKMFWSGAEGGREAVRSRYMYWRRKLLVVCAVRIGNANL